MLGARDAEVEPARALEELVEEHVPLVARHHVVEARRALLVPVVIAPGDLGAAALARAAACVEAVEARGAAEEQRLDEEHGACRAVRLREARYLGAERVPLAPPVGHVLAEAVEGLVERGGRPALIVGRLLRLARLAPPPPLGRLGPQR